MRFERFNYPGLFPGMEAYSAKTGTWNFMIINERGQWTVTYRLDSPTGRVSASSTMMGPFEDFHDAAKAAEAKLAELRRIN